MAAVSALAYAAVGLASEARSQTVASDGLSVNIGGRTLRCGQTPVIMDSEIPTEGMSVPGEGLYLNPFLMKRLPNSVRLFIFKHECAHEVTGPDELGADCIAAKAGAREGWLAAGDIDAVCRSFAGPATSTHPSGKTRCANIRRCYAGTQVASTKSLAAGNAAKTSSWTASNEKSAGESRDPVVRLAD
ncbi:MAG: hypothetical protein MUF20_13510 [Methylotetracoccus sp.]|nr:hypothetical protein [Methylotetracoccus sp.]